MERRHLVNGGLVAGLTALVAPHTAAAATAAPAAAGEDAEVVSAIRQLEGSVESGLRALRPGPFWGVDAIRNAQREWLASFQKYPDFIEVGVRVWDNLFDWHVHYQQPLSMTRRPDGRYVMAFNFTTVVMRPEMQGDYISQPYEAGARQP